MSPKVTSPGKESESYSSLKERRKSLTPVIIVLSPSSQILLAECLTDPIGKSFTPHLLHQPSHERSFYLPASISQSFYLSNCSLCSRSAVLSARRKSLAFFPWLSVPWGVSSPLIWEWFHRTLLICSLFISPNHRPSLFLWLSYSGALVSFSVFACVFVPLEDPLFCPPLVWLSFPGGFLLVIYSS